MTDDATPRPLDRIDRRILTELQGDGRLTNVELSRRVHLSPTPCLERVRRLEREGYIRGYRAELDPAMLDRALLVYIEVSLDRTDETVFEAFKAAIRQQPDVLECHMVAGGFDYLVKARLADMAAYRRFLGDCLVSLPGVRTTHTYVVMEEVKTDARLPVD
ncbi:Lrp/AsnC ligand binding domain-containing protein [Tistrella mobilis]|uniref:Lrp/AsnC ligand binding domain-containing protein n=1 Tax=Tistrella mobilis TaxID=171437 RepID=UPI003558AD20